MGLFDAAESALADLEGRVAALEGGTIEPPIEYEDSGPLTLASNQTIANKRIAGTQLIAINTTSNASGIVTNDATVRNCLLDGQHFGLKVGDGPTSYRMLVDGLTVRNSRQPLCLGYLRDSVFRNMDLQSVTGNEAFDHAIYLCHQCFDLTFEHLELESDGGWGLHLYGDSPSERLTFDDVFVDGKGTGRGIIILSGYKDITISGLTMVNLVTDYPAVQFGDCENVIIENFDIAGGDSLVYAGGWAGIPVNVTLRNGIYRGDGPLIAGDATGITLENVVRA